MEKRDVTLSRSAGKIGASAFPCLSHNEKKLLKFLCEPSVWRLKTVLNEENELNNDASDRSESSEPEG